MAAEALFQRGVVTSNRLEGLARGVWVAQKRQEQQAFLALGQQPEQMGRGAGVKGHLPLHTRLGVVDQQGQHLQRGRGGGVALGQGQAESGVCEQVRP